MFRARVPIAWMAVAALVVVSLLVLGDVRASVVIHYAFEDLVGEADEIVHGRVVAQHSEWREQSIVTEVEMEVLACLKGGRHVGERFSILQHGGVVDDLAMVVPGAPSFREGEEVVLFLEHRPTMQEPLVLGLAQGKFTVVLDGETGQRMVTRTLDGLTLVADDGRLTLPVVVPSDSYLELDLSGSIQERLAREPVWVPLDEFLLEVEATLPIPRTF